MSKASPTLAQEKASEKAVTATRVKPELRVLQVFAVLGVGGAETWLLALLKYFRDESENLPVNVKFDVLLTGGTPAVFDEKAKALGARLFYVPFTRRTLPRFIREFRRILAEGNYDVVHDHQDYIAGLHFLMGLGQLPRVRIAHVHNPLLHISNYVKDPLRKLASSAGKHFLRHFASHVLGTSYLVLGEYGFNKTAYPDTKLGAAHCGFDVPSFCGDSQKARADICAEFGLGRKAKLVLFVGRLDSHRDPRLNQKNPLFALEIAKACVVRDKNVHLLMAGGGEGVRLQLAADVEASNLQQNVHLLGIRSDIPRLMLASDLLLLPSLAEGLGMVAVEAQAAGLPVLASDKTPRECVVVPGLVEFLPLTETAASWADEALRLLNLPRADSDKCNAIVKNSPFSIENSAARLLGIYQMPISRQSAYSRNLGVELAGN
jgi:glycosyltransferase involved in cell wall biosynthesis